ncbi:MAG: TonB-dependent receptor [Pseudomonadota bacterium]
MSIRLFLLSSAAAIAPTGALAAAAASPATDPDTIVVSASPLERPAEAALSAVSVIEGEELRRQAQATLGETLRREPGLSSTFFGAGASRPIIRGLDGERIRTLTNGIGSIDAAAASPDHPTPIEPVLAERIEVIRGSGLLRYGSAANGGVVNVTDGRIPSTVPEKGVNAAARGSVSTVDNAYEFAGGANVLIGEFGGVSVVASGAGAYRDADDYDVPADPESNVLRREEGEELAPDVDSVTLENSFVETESYSGGLSFIGEKGFFGFSVQQFETEYGLPGGHGHGHGEEEHEDEEHEDEDHEDEHGEEEEGGVFIDQEQTRVDVNASLNLDTDIISRIDLFAGYADYEHTEFEGPGEPGTVYDNEGYEIRVEAQQAQRGNWRGASGFQYRSSDFSVIGEEAFVDPVDTDQYGFFSFQEFTFGAALVEGAIRYERTELTDTVDNIDRDFDGFSASLGAAYDLTDTVKVIGNVFRTERAPTATELFADGPHLATNTFEIGDTELDTETAIGVEGGLRFRTDRGYLSVTGFYTDYQDFIYLRDLGITGADILLSRGEDDEEELEEFGELVGSQFTAADASFTGFEIEAGAELGQFWGVDLTSDLVVDYVDAKLSEADSTGSDQLPRIPPLGVIFGVEADYLDFALRTEVEYSAEADDTASFELPTDSYTLVNVYADWEMAENVFISIAALNLANDEARQHTSFIKDVAPLPGRNFRFSLTYRY